MVEVTTEEEFKIKFINWDKYNLRKDVKSASWFKFYHDSFSDPKLYSLTPEEKYMYVALLCYYSKHHNYNNKSGLVTVNSGFIAHFFNAPQELLHRTVAKLKINHILEVRTLRGRYVDVTDTVPRQEEDKNKIRKEENNTYVISDEPKVTSEPFDLNSFVSTWNDNCGNLPKCNKLTDKRKRIINARLKEEQSIDYWKQVVVRIAASDFCAGITQGSAWRASFDWLIQPDTHVKVMEGRYDNKQKQKTNLDRWMEEQEAKEKNEQSRV